MERTPEINRPPERFRKSVEKRNTQIASDNELESAIQTGIQHVMTGQLTIREIKDRANVVSSWIEGNKNRLILSGKEQQTFHSYRQEIHDTFFQSRYYVIGKADKIRLFKNACYKYFEFGKILQDPIERFYFAKDIRPLTLQEIQKMNDYLDEHYDIAVTPARDDHYHSWEPIDIRRSRISVTFHNKGEKNEPYANAISLANHSIEGWDNYGTYDTLGSNRAHLSVIKHRTLQEALKASSIDNFQPRSLSGHNVKHPETERIVFQTIEDYKKNKQETGQPLTEDEKKEIFFFPANSTQFNQIALTPVGKGNFRFLRNYFPDLRCTGIMIRIIHPPIKDKWSHPNLSIIDFPLAKK